ncbi:protein of unknown function (plasmid) [Azospirillum lipoferum 4B]|uniref:Uncharacterized protein n=1 Tax=Azospirillum lipoferum (strain 4B) TaxID=862719 RepID=G7ZIX7_AZOL4|nr:protein of unknown function [Azospirillum lipoferum 4B]
MGKACYGVIIWEYVSMWGGRLHRSLIFRIFPLSRWADTSFSVIPAKAGIQAYPLVLLGKPWIPAFAGMTVDKRCAWLRQQANP